VPSLFFLKYITSFQSALLPRRGKNLAQLIREQFPRPIVLFLGVTSAIAIMATDLAEILGGALGFNILFHIPMFLAALLTGAIVLGFLGLSRFGFRKLEYVIIGMVSIIGLVYVYETALVHPNWGLAIALVVTLLNVVLLYTLF
jgi:manganese transport protein